MFWTNLSFSGRNVIALCHAHGESEPFHSELKSGMNLERLPSGKFETNALTLESGMIAYNILRMIGQESLRKKDAPIKRQLRTVIENLIMMASHLTSHLRLAWVTATLGAERLPGCFSRSLRPYAIPDCPGLTDWQIYLFRFTGCPAGGAVVAPVMQASIVTAS